MEQKNIVITARNFSAVSHQAVELLERAGYRVIDYSGAGFGSRTAEEEIVKAVCDAQIVIAGATEPLNRAVLERCPKLEMISRRGIGYDNVDIDVCRKLQITVARTFGAVEGAVAEQVMAYLLYFGRRIDLQNRSMQQGVWQRIMMPGIKNHTLGLVGFGGIGKEIARRAVPFGMKVIYYCRHPKECWERQYGVSYAPLEELLAASDYVSLNLPLTDETRGMFDRERIGQMKRGSILINVARGAIVSDTALKEAVESGRLAGAAVDVFDREPCTDSVLAGVDRVILTPHTAPYTEENFTEMNRTAAQNVLDYLEGRLLESNRVI